MNLQTRSARLTVSLAGLFLGLTLATGVHAQAAPAGKGVYERACAGCHAAPPPGSRAAPLANLQKMSAAALRTTLTTGVMKGMGDALSPQDLTDVINYLAAAPEGAGTDWVKRAMCPVDQRGIDLKPAPTLAAWGVDQKNSRRMSAVQAGLTTADLGRLDVAWSLNMPGTTTLRGQGAILGSTLFYIAGQSDQLLALDTKTGCIKWASETPSGLRTSLALGRLGPKGALALVAGDSAGQVQAWDAATGKLIWRMDPRPGPSGMLTGTPLFAGSRLLVPISAIDVGLAMRSAYACCQGHGALAALDPMTGKVLWTYHTMEPARPLGIKNSQGVEMMGPSGAPVWSSPSVDLEAGLAFIGTGENTSPPATGTSDSIVAIDLATGKSRWVFQALKNDVWNMSCPSGRESRRAPGVNCFFYESDSVLRDHDFGAGPVVYGSGSHKLILGGQKSGDVWGLDRATGKQVWHERFGEGSALGGVHWGLASDGTRLYVPISDPYIPAPKAAAGLYALDGRTGKLIWSWRATPDCKGDRKAKIAGCEGHYGLSAAPLVIDGAVLAGALDGRLWVFNAATGKVLAVHDTALSFQSATGVTGVGGSIDATGVFAGDGLVFVNSGYGMFGQQPGNVLVAYRPKP